MKVYRNLSAIRTKEQLGRRITLGGLLVLFLGLLSSFIPNWYPPTAPSTNPVIHFLQFNWAYISFGALALGFIASNIGSYYINRFAARRWSGSKQIARPDEMLERSLKGFDDKYSLFLWSLPQSNYLLAGPSGIYVFAIRGDKGKVTVEGDRWREAFTIGRFFTAFTREGLGNPSRELQEEAEQVRVLLQQGEAAAQLTFDTADVPIQAAAVFIHPEVKLDANNPSIPALTTEEVKKFIRDTKGRVLNTGQTRELTEYLKAKSVLGSAETVTS